MRHLVPVLVLLGLATTANARGLLIPTDKKLPPLAILSHQVQVSIEDQVAVTRTEQVFRNHTNRQLEATYVFPVPKGASVQKFTMWVDGQAMPGELVEAAKARKIYTDIVQRANDPGLLEYIGNDLLQFKVFPIQPGKDTKVAVQYTSVAVADDGIVEYVYPLKTDGKATSTLEKFAVTVHLKSQHPLQNIYSPTHQIAITRPNDREAKIVFEKNQALLDRDFQLYYMARAKAKDVGLTALTHRPIASKDGYFLLLVSPRAELSHDQHIPRDFVFVLDTSGSMRGKRIIQARNALKYCLSNLDKRDRFAIINFATTVNHYAEQLQPANPDNLVQARQWVDGLQATGGTAINDALLAALDLRSKEEGRTFTIVFFTDGLPTVGVTNIAMIQKNVMARNTANTRIFTFGVGDDVHATFLDQLSERSRAWSTYVRENEDIEAKVSSLYAKISNPMLANLKLSVGPNVKIAEVYPPQLPDLFHGTQLVVLGRYTGKGHATIKLTGNVGKEVREFVYELKFPEKTTENKDFVEDLWARRKVGYLLDQIRSNGEKKELVEEVVTLAKRYGITTPYTSYLIVPDAPVPVVTDGNKKTPPKNGKPNVSLNLSSATPAPHALQTGKVGNKAQMPVVQFLQNNGQGGFGGMGGMGFGPKPGGLGMGGMGMGGMGGMGGGMGGMGMGGYGGFTYQRHGYMQQSSMGGMGGMGGMGTGSNQPLSNYYPLAAMPDTKQRLNNMDNARLLLGQGNYGETQAGKLGVELSVGNNLLRTQSQLTNTATRRIGDRNALEVGGVWIDEKFDPKMKVVTIKAMSKAYFDLVDRHATMKDVLRLGNHLVWVTPSGTALAIDTTTGIETMTDKEMNALFLPKKK